MPVGFNRNRLPILNKSVSRLKLGIEVDEIVLFSLGNLIERKGFHFLIEAVRLLIEDDRKIVCYIGGEGNYRSVLEKMIEEKGLGRNIRMLGRIPEDDISTWICACDLFIVPSTRESFGLTVVEALACGRPVVATKNGGSEEIIKDDRVGYLCEVKDPVDMAMKIKKALISQWDSEFIIAFAEDYSWQRINIELLALYRRILNRRDG
jgi:glycosyltransferase involved in cell wall biosynthesis